MNEIKTAALPKSIVANATNAAILHSQIKKAKEVAIKANVITSYGTIPGAQIHTTIAEVDVL